MVVSANHTCTTLPDMETTHIDNTDVDNIDLDKTEMDNIGIEMVVSANHACSTLPDMETTPIDKTEVDNTDIEIYGASISTTVLATLVSTAKDNTDVDNTTVDNTVVHNTEVVVPAKRPRKPGDKPHQCIICLKRFVSEGALEDHFHSHPGNEAYVCNICNASFPHKAKYYRHMDKHKQGHCEICNIVFKDGEDKVEHMKKHAGKQLYSCDDCGKVFTKQTSLREHMTAEGKVKEGKETYMACTICHERFRTKSDYEAHIGMHGRKKIYHCDKCGDNFTKQKSFQRHNLLHDDHIPGDSTSSGMVPSPSSSKDELKASSNGHQEDKSEPDILWYRQFKAKPGVRYQPYTADRHIKLSVKPRAGQGSAKGTSYYCNVCQAEFKQMDHLKRHTLIHIRKQLNCDTCGQQFTFRSQLNEHCCN